MENGIICIDKPEGFTSFDVIAKLRGILKMKKLGHSGTLDPMATGVLPVFAGAATRAAELIPDKDKEYRAHFRLGYTSDTLDCTGNVTAAGGTLPGEEALREAAKAFVGEIMQVPPMYSAVQVNGQRLYDLARKGLEVERTPRKVTVCYLDIPRYDPLTGEGEMILSCSKGTYIRSVIADIGEKCGCGGIMTALRRTRACGFTLDDCLTLEMVQAAAECGEVSTLFRPVENVWEYPAVTLDERCTRLYKSGVRLTSGQKGMQEPERRDGFVKIYGCDGTFLALGTYENNELRGVKNFFGA